MIGRVHTNGLHMHSGPNPGVSGLTWCQPTSVRRVPGAAAQAASPARALCHMMTGTKIFSGGEAIGRRLPRSTHRCSRLPAVLGSSRRSPTLSSPVRPLTPLPRSPGADFPNWWTPVITHFNKKLCVSLQTVSDCSIVFASLDCCANIPHITGPNLYWAVKSLSPVWGGRHNNWHLPQMSFNPVYFQ